MFFDLRIRSDTKAYGYACSLMDIKPNHVNNVPVFQVRGFGHGMRAWRFDVLLAAVAARNNREAVVGPFLVPDRVHSLVNYNGENVSGTPLNPATLDIRRIMDLVNPSRA